MDIEKLKQKILDLAIRGKLVSQDPNDEPASVLIEKIRKEKEELIKQGKIKRDKNESYIYKGSDNCYYEKIGSEVKNITDEIPFDIPTNWTWCRFKTVLVVRDGTHDSPKYYSDGVPFVTSKCLKNNTIDFSLCKLISLEDSKRFDERSFVDDKDILFAMIGTIGNATIVNKDREFSIKNVALFKNINRQLLSEKFIKYLLDCLTSKMIEKTSSGLQPFVSLEFLRNYIIPIPPIQEQIKIIGKLDAIFGKLITIQDDRNSLLSLIDNVKNKILDYYFGDNSCYKSYYENNITLGDVLSYEQPWKYTVESTNYDDSYNTPVLTPGKTFILGYTNETTGIYDVGKSKVIIFDDFTTASRLVDFNFKVKSSAMKILTSVDSDKFDIEYLFYLLQTINVISNTHKRYWISEYMPICVNIHAINEQKKIVNKINTMFTILNSMSNSI